MVVIERRKDSFAIVVVKQRYTYVVFMSKILHKSMYTFFLSFFFFAEYIFLDILKDVSYNIWKPGNPDFHDTAQTLTLCTLMSLLTFDLFRRDVKCNAHLECSTLDITKLKSL